MVDGQKFKDAFVNGYLERDLVLYVSIYNNEGHFEDVFDAILVARTSLWHDANDAFEAKIAPNLNLGPLMGKMFYIWKKNQMLIAW
jgi:hypothetical protein